MTETQVPCKEPPETERYDFLISDDGIVSVDAGWQRDNYGTMIRLELVGVSMTETDIAAWSDEQVQAADLWAIAVSFKASDNDDIQVPAKPDFLPERERTEISCA